jgi:hypothetical protein
VHEELHHRRFGSPSGERSNTVADAACKLCMSSVTSDVRRGVFICLICVHEPSSTAGIFTATMAVIRDKGTDKLPTVTRRSLAAVTLTGWCK